MVYANARLRSHNSGYTATLRSASIVSFGSDFVCPQPLYEMAIIYRGEKNDT